MKLVIWIWLLTTASAIAAPIPAPDTLKQFTLTGDYVSSGKPGEVWFSFAPQDTGVYTIVVSSSWGIPVFKYYENRLFTGPVSLPFAKFYSGSIFEHIENWVYELKVASPASPVLYMGVNGGEPGVPLNGFTFGISKSRRIRISSEYSGNPTGDTTFHGSPFFPAQLPDLSLPAGMAFDHWSLISGADAGLNDSLNPVGKVGGVADFHLRRHLRNRSPARLEMGRNLVSLHANGLTGYPSAGIYCKFQAPEPGYYGYRIGRDFRVTQEPGDGVPVVGFFTWITVKDSSGHVFKDSISNAYSILLTDEGGSMQDRTPFTFEIAKASLTLNLEETTQATMALADGVPKFVPGWTSPFAIKADLEYRLDSAKVVKGDATLGPGNTITLRSDATVKAFLTKRPVFPLSAEWQIRDFASDVWKESDVAFSFTAPSTDTFVVAAVLGDTLQSFSLQTLTSIRQDWGSGSGSTHGQAEYVFSGQRDSTYIFKTLGFYIPGCKQFAITARKKGANLSGKPDLCATTAALQTQAGRPAKKTVLRDGAIRLPGRGMFSLLGRRLKLLLR